MTEIQNGKLICFENEVIWLYNQYIFQETETCYTLERWSEFKVLTKENKSPRFH